MALTYIMRVLSGLIGAYTFLCFLRIILTWIPSMNYSRFTQVIAKITDPYLNLFRGIRWLVIGSFDFSPAVALCVLSILSTITNRFANGGRITVALFLSMLVQMFWSIISSVLIFIIILFVIRLIVLLVKGNSYGDMLMEQLDRTLYKIVYNIVRPFVGKNRITYKTALIASSLILLAVNVAGTILFNYLSDLVSRIPF